MTPLLLQMDLKEELKEITKNFLLKDEEGERVAINFYEQDIPLRFGDSQELPFPFIIVKIDSGSIPESGDSHNIKTNLIIGIYDDDTEKQGYKDALNIMQKIYERFAKNPILKGKYKMLPTIEWVLEDDLYPHFFGGMELNWQTAVIRREDEFV